MEERLSLRECVMAVLLAGGLARGAGAPVRTFPDFIVTTPNGDFAFSDLQQSVETPRALIGKVTNRSGIWWDSVVFDIIPSDRRSTRFHPGALSIDNFAAGETLPFRVTLDRHYDHPSVRFSFRYMNGAPGMAAR